MNKESGFSLVELLVAMAIIAVLISIGAFGISIVQSNARNTKRRKLIEDMQLSIEDYKVNNHGTPPSNVSPTNSMTTEVTFSGNNTEDLVFDATKYGFQNIYLISFNGGTQGSCSRLQELFTDHNIEIDIRNISYVCYDLNQAELGIILERSENLYITEI